MSNVMTRNAGVAERMSDHAMMARAKELTQVSPALLQEAQRAARELADAISGRTAGGVERNQAAGRPELVPPGMRSARAEAAQDVHVSVVLASLMMAVEGASLDRLAFNARSSLEQNAARAARAEQLSQQYDKAQKGVTQALSLLDQEKARLDVAAEKVDSLADDLAKAQAALDKLDSQAPEYKSALALRDTLRQRLADARSGLSEAQEKVKVQAAIVSQRQEEVQGLYALAQQTGADLPRASVEKDQGNLARMIELMSKLGELILKNGEERTEVQHELLRIQENARVEKLAKDADRADRELAKAEAMSKTMGCVGKVLGAVITAAAVIGAVFTGGASLLLVGVGLALMMADKVYEGVTGKSFVEEAMKPVMHLIQPVLQLVMDKLACVLTKFGVDAQTAKMAAMIAVSVAIAVAVVAVMITGVGGAAANAIGNVMSRLGTVMTKVMEKTIARLIPEMLKKSVAQMARRISATAMQSFDAASQRLGLSTDVAAKQIYAARMGNVAAGANFAKTTSDGALGVGIELSNREVARAVADMTFTMSELDLLRGMFADLLERTRTAFSGSEEIFKRASEMIAAQTQAGVTVARSVAHMRMA